MMRAQYRVLLPFALTETPGRDDFVHFHPGQIASFELSDAVTLLQQGRIAIDDAASSAPADRRTYRFLQRTMLATPDPDRFIPYEAGDRIELGATGADHLLGLGFIAHDVSTAS